MANTTDRTNATNARKPFSLNVPAGNFAGPVRHWLTSGVEKLFGLEKLNRLYADLPSSLDSVAFLDAALESLQIRVAINELEIAHIPKTGPLIIVANHPFGAVEGIILARMMLRIRPDTKVLANYLLKRIPEISDLFIAVDPFGGSEATRRNIGPVRAAQRWLESGGALIVFPAGEVSSLILQSRIVTDPKWQPLVGRLALSTGAKVVPCFFHGRNSAGFHIAGLIQSRLRTVLIPREFLNKAEGTICVSLGAALDADRLKGFECPQRLTDFFRFKTYVLQSNPSVQSVSENAPAFEQVIAVAEPEPDAWIRDEIAALGPQAYVLEEGNFTIYCARAADIPRTLSEIGRLREVTFRATGEGTGNSRDLDAFDAYYLHLFLWDKLQQRIVGAYRMAPTDEVIPRFGTRGLYSHTLFNYPRRFLEELGPAIELGRSFVRAEYQRSYTPLLALWKGIFAWLLRNPHYKTFFGPVSISAAYHVVSRQLLVRYLLARHGDERLRSHVKPRRSFGLNNKALMRDAIPEYSANDIEELSSLLAEMEIDGKGVPVLIRQYLKLGGRILGFNVDERFNDCLDGLIVVDATKIDRKMLQRYMGREGAERYLALHQTTTDDWRNVS